MKLSIVIPAYNEENNIDAIMRDSLDSLSKMTFDGEIVVVDDGSTDNTFSRLKEIQENDSRVRLFKHASRKGLGAALLSGYNQSTGEFVTWLPADGQIHPSQLCKLLNEIGKYDFVTATYVKRSDVIRRRFVSRMWRILMRLIMGYNFDFNGNYMFRRERFKGLNLKATTGLMNFELIYKALLRGYSVTNVYISCSARVSGKSKVCNPQTIVKTLWEMFKIRFSV